MKHKTLEQYELQLIKTKSSADEQVVRISDLMKRRSSSRWSPSKKQKMVRRLVAAQDASAQCQSMLEQIIVEKASDK